VLPGLHALRRAEAGELSDVLWFQTGRAVEQTILAGAGAWLQRLPFERVVLPLEPPGGGAPSLSQLSLLTAPATLRARKALRAHGSQVVLGLGGFSSLPVVLAARSLGLPVVLLEINAVPGMATRWLAPLSRAVAHAWPRSRRDRGASPDGRTAAKEICTGPPLAPQFERGPPTVEEQRRCRAELGFDPLRPLIAVLGGSQGAQALNRFVSAHVWSLVEQRVQVFHQVGPGRAAEAAHCDVGYRAVEFQDDVRGALCAATLVLCRGGASTLAEVAALARPAWVVPYPHARDRHQDANARALGAGVRSVPESELGPAFAAELGRLAGLAGEPERRAMAAALDGSVPRNGARALLDLLHRTARRASGPTAAARAPATLRLHPTGA
jgi:UDP-N-acetylglucosamine--N-acetylmuramyl-(pentapeptide) pyrophosphoryl-undecaprenol N-acetylglucosamine transferase